MQGILILMFLLSFIEGARAADNRVRRIDVGLDEIAKVRTSPGVATIIQFPERPNSLVLGDSGSFKVEYLQDAITVKPVAKSSKTNLFIFTDLRRYNVHLVSGEAESADYVVRIGSKQSFPAAQPRAVEFTRVLKLNEFEVSTRSLWSSESMLGIRLKIKSLRSTILDPGMFWIYGGKQVVPIEQIMLESLRVERNSQVSGEILIRKRDVPRDRKLRLVLKSKGEAEVDLPGISKWR